MTVDLVSAIQRKVAVSAIPASAMRNQGAPGTVAAAREFLSAVRLRPFATKSASAFHSALDEATDRLCAALPRDACSWGTSRKAMNLFLRDAFYNKFLHDAFKLDRAEPHFEVPLDGIVATGLARMKGGTHLSPWRGVKHLCRETSDEYQAFAQSAAQRMGIPRVHLDTLLWPAFSRAVSAD